MYTADSILFEQNKHTIQKIIRELQDADIQLTVDVTVSDFLGVSITDTEDGIHLRQTLLIPKILQDLHTTKASNPPTAPENPSATLHAHKDGNPFDNSFNYRSMMGN